MSCVSSHLSQVVEVYRSKLRDDLPGPEGDEIARIRIENYANKIRPSGFLVRVRFTFWRLIHPINYHHRITLKYTLSTWASLPPVYATHD